MSETNTPNDPAAADPAPATAPSANGIIAKIEEKLSAIEHEAVSEIKTLLDELKAHI